MIADASVAVSILVRAEQCTSEVLAGLGRSHSRVAGLLEGQAASTAAQLPEMQEIVTCAICLEKQVSVLSAGVVRCQMELDEKTQSLSTLVTTCWHAANCSGCSDGTPAHNRAGKHAEPEMCCSIYVG